MPESFIPETDPANVPMARLAAALESVAASNVQLAASANRSASALPMLADEYERLAFAFMPSAVAARPLKPEKVTNAASRAALLAFNLAESFIYWRDHHAKGADRDTEGATTTPADQSF